MNKKPSVRIVTATEAKNRFGALIKGTYLHEEHLIVKRGGIPVVAIVPIADYERLINGEDVPADVQEEVATRGKEERARSRLLDLLDEAHATMPDVPEEEVEQDIAEAVQAVRRRP